jgi:hypothetical protein
MDIGGGNLQAKAGRQLIIHLQSVMSQQERSGEEDEETSSSFPTKNGADVS